MMTPEKFQDNHWAIERGALNGQQSLVRCESGKEIVMQSRRLMEAWRNPEPLYRAASE